MEVHHEVSDSEQEAGVPEAVGWWKKPKVIFCFYFFNI